MSTLTNIAVSAVTGAVAAGAVVLAGSVSLQDATPGTVETGHSNISGYSLAGRFGANTSPTLARVQVNETGSLQGVRSITGDGVSVYGQSTATTGLGAGGYFTSSSVGGRGMVGDALSGSGNTVGGLFYNRSSGGGVGVWGRAIGGGTATGVFGQTTSATGTGLSASNTATGDSMAAAGPNGSLYTSGELPRHEYSTGVASAMVPIAYGVLNSLGGVHYGSPNWTGSHEGTGLYEVDVANASFSRENSVTIATSYGSGGTEAVTVDAATTGDIRLSVRDGAGTLIDSAIYFVIYRNSHSAPTGSPEPAKRFNGNIEVWQKKDPQGYEAYRKAFIAWQREQMLVTPFEAPIDRAPRP